MQIIETSRLLLRKPEITDLEPLFQIHANPATNLYNPAGPVKNREIFQQELNKLIEHHEKYGFGYYVIIDKSDDSYVGVCGLKHVNIKNKPYLNLYYRITPNKMRRGYVNEACQAIIDNVGKLSVIVVLTLNANIPSIRTAMSLGFKHDRSLDDYDGDGNVYYFKIL